MNEATRERIQSTGSLLMGIFMLGGAACGWAVMLYEIARLVR